MIKKVYKSLILSLITFIMFFDNGFLSLAQGAYNVIDYNSEIIVKSNNVIDVTNEITIRPYSNDLEIEYEIPTKLNGNKVKVSNVNVKNASFKRIVNKENNLLVLKDDKANITKTYTISYSLDFGEDYDKTKDYLELLIVPSLKSAISKLNLSLVMPSEFAASNLNCITLVDQGKVSEDNFQGKFRYTYNKESNVLNATLKESLDYSESLTLKMQLPEGYFTNERNNYFKSGYMLLISFVFFISMFVTFFVTGRDEEIICGKSLNLPEFMPPCSIGLFNKLVFEKRQLTDNCNNLLDSLVPMIIHWANKGYITIKENCVNDINGDKNIIITRQWNINEDDEIPIYEKMLFNTLFLIGDDGVVDFKNVRFALNNGTFGQERKNKIKEFILAYKNTENDYIYNVITEGKNKEITQRIKMLKIAPIVFFNIFGFVTAITNFVVISDLFYPVIYLIISVILALLLQQDNKNQHVLNTIYMILNGIFALGLKLNGIIYVLTLIASFLFIITRKYNFKFASYIKSVKEFKKTLAQKDNQEIVQYVSQNPSYFYKALPYVISLDLSETFTKMFERSNVTSPIWYVKNEYSNKNLNPHNIDKFIDEFKEFFKTLESNL